MRHFHINEPQKSFCDILYLQTTFLNKLSGFISVCTLPTFKVFIVTNLLIFHTKSRNYFHIKSNKNKQKRYKTKFKEEHRQSYRLCKEKDTKTERTHKYI